MIHPIDRIEQLIAEGEAFRERRPFSQLATKQTFYMPVYVSIGGLPVTYDIAGHPIHRTLFTRQDNRNV